MPRKTIDVEYIKNEVNQYLLNSADEDEDTRKGMATLLEHVLFKTDSYKGYNNLSPDQMKKSTQGKTPGINHYEYTPEIPDTRYIGCLDYRRYYY